MLSYIHIFFLPLFYPLLLTEEKLEDLITTEPEESYFLP